MKKFTVEVRQIVEVQLDEENFDEAFMEEFREVFYPFMTLADHAEHIAQLQARGLTNLEFNPDFIEGYGESDDMGIRARVTDYEMEVLWMPTEEQPA